MLALYREHPLHRPTVWRHGFTMLTKEQAGALDERWTTPRLDEAPAADAAA